MSLSGAARPSLLVVDNRHDFLIQSPVHPPDCPFKRLTHFLSLYAPFDPNTPTIGGYDNMSTVNSDAFVPNEVENVLEYK